MIIRTWTGRTTPEAADDYERLLTGEILPAIAEETEGYRGHDVGRRRPDGTKGDRIEFLTILRFDSWDAVRAFAGEDEEYERAHVPDAARRLLVDHDDRADHYEVVGSERV